MDIAMALQEGRGLIHTPEHRPLRNRLSRAVAKGQLIRLHPRVLVAPDLVDDPMIRVRAALLWRPDLIIMGRAAARLTFWPDCRLTVVEAAGSKPGTVPEGIRVRQLKVPPDLRIAWEQGFITHSALTVLDLCEAGDWAALCEALRRGVVTLTSLEETSALLAGRHRLTAHRECLRRAAGNPWSVPEMDLQQLYRDAGITGWVGNRPLDVGGRRTIPDIAFDAERVAIEVEGREFHDNPRFHESDCERQNRLVTDGWRILRVTPRMIWQDPEVVVASTRKLLAGRAVSGVQGASWPAAA